MSFSEKPTLSERGPTLSADNVGFFLRNVIYLRETHAILDQVDIEEAKFFVRTGLGVTKTLVHQGFPLCLPNMGIKQFRGVIFVVQLRN